MLTQLATRAVVLIERLGPALAWQLMQLSLGRLDWILIAASLPLAAILTHSPARRE